MLIRTQNKKALVDITRKTIMMNAYTKQTNEGVSYNYNIEASGFNTLGTYSTEDKAIKVLDMIQKAYEDANNFHYVANRVFIMPADEEVI